MSALDDLLRSRGVGSPGTKPAADASRPERASQISVPRIYRDVVQGTQEWIYMRAGIPTASAADRIITPGGKATADTTSEKYLYELLAERITGQPVVEAPKLWWAERGKELEEQARTGYEFDRNVEVLPVSFITDDLGRWGCSPDGLVDDDGLVEFKAPNAADHLALLMKSGVAFKKYGIQTQFQLFVCQDRAWVDLSSYYPGLPQAIVRFTRDEAYQKLIEKEATEFSVRLEAMYADVIAKGWNVNWRRPKDTKDTDVTSDTSQDSLVKAMKESLVSLKK